MILLIITKLFFFHGEGIEFYQIPEKDSTTFYFIYRLNAKEFPSQISKGKKIRCVSVYGEVGYKHDIKGAFWDMDTIKEDSETYAAIKHIKVKRHKNYNIKTTVSTCHLLKRFEKEEKEKDLYPVSSLIPSVGDSMVRFAWYFDTTGYIDVYSLLSDSGLLKIKKAYGASTLREQKVFIRKGWNFIPLNFKGLSPGEYQFVLYIGPYKREVSCSILMGSGWTKEDWELMLMAVRYIFTNQELDSLEHAPINEKRKLWDKYWERRDPTPNSPQNEAYLEFLRRFRYAEEHYRSIFAKTLSDMAIIYITLGPPDEEERHEFEQNVPPYIVWYYYKYNLRFRFEDRFGAGYYELVDPPHYMLDEIMESVRK